MAQEASQLQLRANAAPEWRETNDRRMAIACYRAMGKILWQASYPKAASIDDSHSSRIHFTR